MKKEASQLKKEAFEDIFDETRCGRYERFLWDLMEKPHTSLAAKVIVELNRSYYYYYQIIQLFYV